MVVREYRHSRGSKLGEPMRHLPGVKLLSNDLIDDMHKAYEAVCARLRLQPKTDRATEMVAAKIVQLAKAGRRGGDLTAEERPMRHACLRSSRSAFGLLCFGCLPNQ
jgi:hypothetical protein